MLVGIFCLALSVLWFFMSFKAWSMKAFWLKREMRWDQGAFGRRWFWLDMVVFGISGLACAYVGIIEFVRN